uniref:Uncharacterized protein LOC104248923 n=1 Tax=Nicotiana sylvestris TaxID=4096 RepID=A0A1U7YXX4_NICSY|nr:PREDICTED: uncharacterized protein LOC104248923 [Nicotiana sylvestris]
MGFLLEENYSGETELDEVQETNESTQNQYYETQVEEPLLDVLKLTRKLPYSTVKVQELNVVQEQVNEPVPNQIEQQSNLTQGEQVVQAPLIRYNMDNSKRGYLAIGIGITFSREDCPKNPEERERMSRIPYASVVGAIICRNFGSSRSRMSVRDRVGTVGQGEEFFNAITKLPLTVYGSVGIRLYWIRVAGIFVLRNRVGSVGQGEELFNAIAEVRSGLRSVYRLCFTSAWARPRSSRKRWAEYIAASETAKEVVWMKKFSTKLGMVPSIEGAVPLLCDNAGAIAQAKEPRSYQKIQTCSAKVSLDKRDH